MNNKNMMSRHREIQHLAGKKLFFALILFCLPATVMATDFEDIDEILEKVNNQEIAPQAEQVASTRQILADYNPWEQWAEPGFGNPNTVLAFPFVEYKDYFYYTTFNGVDGSEIYRATVDGAWEQFGTSGFGYGIWGMVDDMWVYSDYLYISISSDSNAGADILRYDGNTLEQIVWNGLGDVFNDGFHNLGQYEDYFYIYSGNDGTGINFFRTKDGLTYEQVWGPGLNNDYNYYINSFIKFGNNYYMSLRNREEGCHIYRTSDLENWTELEDDGFGDANYYSCSLSEFKDKLYVRATPYTHASGPIKLYRTANGTDYELITEGFGDNENDWSSIDVYNKYLYMGTSHESNNGQLHRSKNGTDWEDITSQLDGLSANDTDLNVENIGGQLFVRSWDLVEGVKIWKYNNNDTWTRWNTDGFGDVNNFYMYESVFENYWVIGTYNLLTNPSILRQDLFGARITDLEIKNVRDKKVNLSWSVPRGTNLATYTIKRYSEPLTQDNWYQAKTVKSGKAVDQSKTTQKKKNLKLKKKKTYYYGIRTINDQGIKSQISNSPGIIRSLDTKKIKKTQAKLKWSADERAFTYTVQLRTKNGKKLRAWKEISNTYKNIPVGYLTSGKNYKWRVRSIEGDGDKSVWSQYKSFTTN